MDWDICKQLSMSEKKWECDNMTEILGVVVIYNPDINKLINNINRYLENITSLMIWQNSVLSQDQREKIEKETTEGFKILFVGDGTNQGLDVAFNYSFSYAKKAGYNWLLTMDQDSEWNNFARFLTDVNNCEDSEAGIFGPEIINAFDITSTCDDDKKNNRYEQVDFVISSGALYSINILEKLDGFTKDFFIDAIDEEICYRASAMGIITVKVKGSFLVQEFGNYKKKKFLGKTIATSNYSAFRYYYIVRNHLRLAKSGLVKGKTKKIMIHNYIISPFFKVILFENCKTSKLRAIVKGTIDGLKKY